MIRVGRSGDSNDKRMEDEPMGKLTFGMMVSLDGYVAGPALPPRSLNFTCTYHRPPIKWVAPARATRSAASIAGLAQRAGQLLRIFERYHRHLEVGVRSEDKATSHFVKFR